MKTITVTLTEEQAEHLHEWLEETRTYSGTPFPLSMESADLDIASELLAVLREARSV